MCIVFAANRSMLAGLCASLGSLVAALRGKAQLPVFVFHADLAESIQGRICRAVRHIDPEVRLQFRAVDIMPYVDLLPLQGDHMTYVRLGLPRLLPDFDKILYLDSDMVFTSGIVELLDLDLCGHLFGASGVCPA